MVFSYNWIQDYIKEKIPNAQKIADIFTFHSFEIEELKKRNNDWIIDIDILPNRGHDCLSHIGIAREICVLLGLKINLPKISKNIKKLNKNKASKKYNLRVNVKNTDDCPRYSAIIIKDIKGIGDSPDWMQERLKTCGLKPINVAVDITNYVMLETGQPLHCFDYEKVGDKIVVRRAREGESIVTLDNIKYKLDKDILVISDKQNPIAIAGIKGGESTGISKTTKSIIIEAGNFKYNVIRKASKKLKLRTDASWRFENQIDPNLIDFALWRAKDLIEKYTKGSVLDSIIDIYPKKRKSKKIKLDLEYMNRLLGVKISKQRAKSILNALGCQCSDVDDNNIEVEAPTRRLDLNIQEDLIEEVARIYGYENIPAVFPKSVIKPLKRNKEMDFENKIKDILREIGFNEAYNYSFIGEEEKQEFSFKQNKLVEITNPISSLNKYLRPSLMPYLIRNIKHNLKFFDEVMFFEIGKIFTMQKTEIKEEKIVAMAFGKKRIKESDFYKFKGMVEAFIKALNIKSMAYDIAQINKQTLYFEVPFNKILQKADLLRTYEKIRIHPPVFMDLSIIVPIKTEYEKIAKIIDKMGAPILSKIELSDIYSGKGIPQGKKNITFHLTYHIHRTLSSEETRKTHQRIIKELEKNKLWQIRK